MKKGKGEEKETVKMRRGGDERRILLSILSKKEKREKG